MNRTYSFNYAHFDALADLSAADRELAAGARKACAAAHAPFSHFQVGAAARLRSGKILTGANQESEVFPATMCAERTLLFHWQAHHADDPVEAIAIASRPGERECYPCGQCRQVLLDVERRQGSPIRVIMCSDNTASAVYTAEALLPFQFVL